MSWRTLTEADLRTALSATELANLRAALGGDTEDTVATTLQLLAAEIRDYIASGGADVSATAYTLPEGVIAQAINIAVVRLSTRAGGILQDPGKLREKAANDAKTFFLDRVATGEQAIETPTTPATDPLSNTPPRPSYTAKNLTLTRESQNGA